MTQSKPCPDFTLEKNICVFIKIMNAIMAATNGLVLIMF